MQPIRSALPLKGSWRLPPLGHPADTAPPPWVVERMISGHILINRLGGFSIQDSSDPRSCVAGDLVELNADETIGFRRPEEV